MYVYNIYHLNIGYNNNKNINNKSDNKTNIEVWQKRHHFAEVNLREKR